MLTRKQEEYIRERIRNNKEVKIPCSYARIFWTIRSNELTPFPVDCPSPGLRAIILSLKRCGIINSRLNSDNSVTLEICENLPSISPKQYYRRYIYNYYINQSNKWETRYFYWNLNEDGSLTSDHFSHIPSFKNIDTFLLYKKEQIMKSYKKYIGYTPEDAAKLSGLTFRAIEVDGESLMYTADFRKNRINVATKNGKIVEIISQG